MTESRTLAELETPAAVVDLDRMAANLDRMAAYVETHGLRLRPHTKTHKAPARAKEQTERGAVGVTVATPHEAEVMSRVSDDILVAYPPVSRTRVERLLALPDRVRIGVALDSREAVATLADAARAAGRAVGVLVEVDVGMRRCGVAEPPDAVALARDVAGREGLDYRGLMFYPGSIRGPVDRQGSDIEALNATLTRHLDALSGAGLEPSVVSGGSTPTAFRSHEMEAVTEIRPGTYIYNDRTTAAIGACDWEDCAYSVLATVISTAVPGQAVVDAGAKALAKEELRAPGGSPNRPTTGYGVVLDRPDAPVRALSEEHGIIDLSNTAWRPDVGDRVRVIPNHVCVSVNLHDRVHGVRGDAVETTWAVAARGWARDPVAAATG